MTFTVDMANGAEQLSLQLSGIVIDEVEQAGVSTILELCDHKLTTTVVGRDGFAFEGADIEALASQFGTNVTIKKRMKQMCMQWLRTILQMSLRLTSS